MHACICSTCSAKTVQTPELLFTAICVRKIYAQNCPGNVGEQQPIWTRPIIIYLLRICSEMLNVFPTKMFQISLLWHTLQICTSLSGITMWILAVSLIASSRNIMPTQLLCTWATGTIESVVLTLECSLLFFADAGLASDGHVHRRIVAFFHDVWPAVVAPDGSDGSGAVNERSEHQQNQRRRDRHLL